MTPLYAIGIFTTLSLETSIDVLVVLQFFWLHSYYKHAQLLNWLSLIFYLLLRMPYKYRYRLRNKNRSYSWVWHFMLTFLSATFFGEIFIINNIFVLLPANVIYYCICILYRTQQAEDLVLRHCFLFTAEF